MDSAVLLATLRRVAMGATALPDNLRSKIPGTENPVEQHPQIVTGGWIAMQIQAAGWFEDAMKFDEARRHHREIRHHR